MDGRLPVSRRKARSRQISVALGVLTVATLAVAGSLISANSLVLGAAGFLAVVAGWVETGQRAEHFIVEVERPAGALE